jgi:hypothetical protein
MVSVTCRLASAFTVISLANDRMVSDVAAVAFAPTATKMRRTASEIRKIDFRILLARFNIRPDARIMISPLVRN